MAAKNKGLKLSLSKFKKLKFGKFTLEFTQKKIAFLLAVLFIAAALYYYKGTFIAATVNGHPVGRLKVVRQLEKYGGMQALDSIITEELIKQEARTQSVEVSTEEVNAEIQKIEEGLKAQGQNLDQALSLQGMTRSELESRIRLQKIAEKLATADTSVSNQEITDYLSSNKDYFPTTMSEEERRAEARTALTSQKKSTQIQTWLTDLKAKAKINYFVDY